MLIVFLEDLEFSFTTPLLGGYNDINTYAKVRRYVYVENLFFGSKKIRYHDFNKDTCIIKLSQERSNLQSVYIATKQQLSY